MEGLMNRRAQNEGKMESVVCSRKWETEWERERERERAVERIPALVKQEGEETSSRRIGKIAGR